jgi:hypothetical protein
MILTDWDKNANLVHTEGNQYRGFSQIGTRMPTSFTLKEINTDAFHRLGKECQPRSHLRRTILTLCTQWERNAKPIYTLGEQYIRTLTAKGNLVRIKRLINNPKKHHKRFTVFHYLAAHSSGNEKL